MNSWNHERVQQFSKPNDDWSTRTRLPIWSISFYRNKRLAQTAQNKETLPDFISCIFIIKFYFFPFVTVTQPSSSGSFFGFLGESLSTFRLFIGSTTTSIWSSSEGLVSDFWLFRTPELGFIFCSSPMTSSLLPFLNNWKYEQSLSPISSSEPSSQTVLNSLFMISPM